MDWRKGWVDVSWAGPEKEDINSPALWPALRLCEWAPATEKIPGESGDMEGTY